MSVINTLLESVEIPDFAVVKQDFSDEHIEDVRQKVIDELSKKEISETIHPGMKVAITCGSRGIDNYVLIVRTIVDFLKKAGAEPFIVSAMGSHGGASVEGQREILAGYGIVEENVGCPLKIGTDTRIIGYINNDIPVQIDAYAAEADGIILLNRIKAHTAFNGPFESGLMKMMAIGLAKQAGADYCHAQGFGNMAENIPMFGKAIMEHSNVMFGLALVENSFDKDQIIEALLPGQIEEREPELLEISKKNLSHILVPEADVLIVHEIGKNISGDGMDPNVSGTFATKYAHGGIQVQRVAVLNIAKESHGNTIGWGMADMSTQKALDCFDKEKTYPNSLTCRVTKVSKIPMIFDNDRKCIQAALKTCEDVNSKNAKIVYIKNTRVMKKIMISKALQESVKRIPSMKLITEFRPLDFDENDNIGIDYFA